VVAEIIHASAKNAMTALRDEYAAHGPVRTRMIFFIIALAIACVVFWRAALRILLIVALILLASGAAMLIQNLHHIVK
jgi:diacylglycerol kinase